MILIDTSVWVRFFKGSEEAKFTAEKIRENAALLHPLIFGELLLGGISTQIESLLQALPSAQLPSTETIFRFLKQHTFPGKGIGWVDAALLCSVQEAGAVLATFDENLRSCAEDIGIACLVIA